MGKKVVITDYQYENIDAERRIIGAHGYELYDYQIRDAGALIPVCRDADAIVTQYSDVSAELIDSLEHCAMIIKYGIGVNNIDVEAATRKGIYVCNVPDYGVEEVSDHAVAMMLALSKKLPVLTRALREGDWGYGSTVPLSRFCESTVGLVAIRVCDPYADAALVREYGAEPLELDELLAESDFISVHVPLTRETRGMIGEAEFCRMKPTAVVINTARGGVIDEKALVEALKTGRIAGAAVDVYEEEPVKADNPLLHMDNVIATPHCAWYSETAITTLQRKVAEEVVNVLDGNKPFNCINLS